MQRIFILSKDINNNVVSLTQDQYHHLITVCRLKPKSKLEIVINETRLLLVRIKYVDLNQLNIDIVDQWELNASRSIPVQLIQSLPKQDKLTEICRVCTEIGVQTFHPVITDFCDVKELSDNKYKRAMMAIDSAAKQSKQSAIPLIKSVKTIVDFLETTQFSNNSLKLVAYENSDKRLSSIVNN
ncbi:MAG: RsmE family RNA methyltransferase, partial [Candidatus Margulisiibacteriota bacterium]|nr:RsmE family RNA methyltransferase [Candidatus Margulisiibacteriota bacterium]